MKSKTLKKELSLTLLFRLLFTIILLVFMCLGYKLALYISVILISIAFEITNYHMKKIYQLLRGMKNDK